MTKALRASDSSIPEPIQRHIRAALLRANLPPEMHCVCGKTFVLKRSFIKHAALCVKFVKAYKP